MPLEAYIQDWTHRLKAHAGSGDLVPDDEPWFDREAQRLFALQWESNSLYQGFCRQRGIRPDTLRHWKQIPAVPTEAFKDLPLSSLPESGRRWYFESSGTTQGRRGRHWHDAKSRSLYEASILAGTPAALLPRDRGRVAFLSLTPSPDLAPHSSLVHMFATWMQAARNGDSRFLGRVDGAGAWTLEWECLKPAFRDMERKGVSVGVLGTAFDFVRLGDLSRETGTSFHLPAGSVAVETGGYKGRTRILSRIELHALIRETLGLETNAVWTEYGMCELSSQAYARPQPDPTGDAPFRFPSWCRARVIHPETGREAIGGETGLLRIVDLANAASVLAVDTGDLAMALPDGAFLLQGRIVDLEPKGCSLLQLDHAPTHAPFS